MVRKRGSASTKVSSLQNRLSTGKSTPTGAAPEKTITSDFPFYARISVLIIVIMGVSGFLLYPDILSLVKTVQNTVAVDTRETSHKADPVVQQESKRTEEDFTRAQMKFDQEQADGDDDFVHAEQETTEDLMENEESEKEQIKVADLNAINDKKIKKKDSVASTKTAKKKVLSRDSQTAEPNSKVKMPPRRPGSKTQPIILTAENNEITLDPSQIKFVDSEKERQPEKKTQKTSGKEQNKLEESSQTKKKSYPGQKNEEQTDGDSAAINNPQASVESSNKTPSQESPNRRSDSTDNIRRRRPGSKKDPIILNAANNQVLLDASQIKIVDSERHKEDESGGWGEQTSNKRQSSKSPSTKDDSQTKKNKQNKSSKSSKSEKKAEIPKTKEEQDIENFKATYHKTFTPKKIFADGRRIPPVELLHQKESNSSVRVFMFNDFLSEQECDGLVKAHDNHVKAMDKPPILCFDSINTLKKHIENAKKKIKVTPQVFTEGTKCVNATFSVQLQSWLKANWSYSTVFYPGESKFSTAIGYRIQQAMGLDPSSGGKFQITSYPKGKAYKEHHDCLIDGVDKRDRVASVLMYLNDVEDGGETAFPELGIWVKPKKGRALVWNNMSPEGKCEPDSQHVARVVKKGSKYILIRWYYYKTFYSLGKRPPPPSLPPREDNQPMVSCDEYGSGSCRWYDEWSYEPLLEYQTRKLKLV